MAEVDCRYMGSLQSYTITYPDPDETLLGTPEALPTSEPGTAQIEYTIASGHLPTVSPAGLRYTLIANVYAGGQNGAGSAATVYYRVKRNGVDVATGSHSVDAGYYWTLNIYKYMAGLAVGDTITVHLWASIAGTNWDYKALACKMSALCPGMAVGGLQITLPSTRQPSLVLGNPYSGNPAHVQIWWDSHYVDTNVLGLPITLTAKLWTSHLSNGLFKAYFGHANNSVILLPHSSYRPYYVADRSAPTAISFRPLTLRV